MEKPIVYLALGDSLTEGVGSQSGGFVPRYSAIIESTFQQPVVTWNYAKSGMPSSELVRLLQRDDVRNRIKQANIITITIGGNDLIQAGKTFLDSGDQRVFRHTVEILKQQMNKIISSIKSLKSQTDDQFFVRIIGLYNPFPQFPQGQIWIQQFNRVLASFQSNHTTYVDINAPFRAYGSQLLFNGGIHPNDRGYDVITKQLVLSGFRPLK